MRSAYWSMLWPSLFLWLCLSLLSCGSPPESPSFCLFPFPLDSSVLTHAAYNQWLVCTASLLYDLPAFFGCAVMTRRTLLFVLGYMPIFYIFEPEQAWYIQLVLSCHSPQSISCDLNSLSPLKLTSNTFAMRLRTIGTSLRSSLLATYYLSLQYLLLISLLRLS